MSNNIFTEGIDNFWGMWGTNKETTLDEVIKKAKELEKAGYEFRLFYASNIDGSPRAEIFIKRKDIDDNEKFIRFLELD